MKKLEIYKVWDLVGINNYIWRYEEANKELMALDFNLDALFKIADKVDKGFFIKGFWTITWMVIDWWINKYVVNNESYSHEWLFILDDVNDWINILNYINFSSR
jgi:hypothetical protein